MIVLDTNILLLNADNILTIGDVVVIPETVLAETDKHKGGFDEINFQARAVARLLDEAEVVTTIRTDGCTSTELLLQGKVIKIVALDKYEADAEEYGGNDRRIIEVAKKLGCPLMTNDTHMKFQAIAGGVETTSLQLVDDEEPEFVKELTIEDPEVFRTLHNSSILGVDPEYKIENYSYLFTCDYTGQVKLSTIHNGHISIIGKDTEQKLRQQEAPPMNTEQLLLSKAIQDPLIDLVLVEARAGSGKTVTAISNAIALMKLHRDKYTSIIYVRNSVVDLGSKDEDTGFVSGNEEKVNRFLHPLEDTLDFLVRKKIKTKGKKPDEVETLVAEGIEELRVKYKIQSMITNDMRGRTFPGAIVVVDEPQNMGTNTMQKVLTRMGKGTKVILTGSQKQIDSFYINKYNNGLAILLDEAKQRKLATEVSIFAVNLHKVLRSPLSEFAEDLFSKSK